MYAMPMPIQVTRKVMMLLHRLLVRYASYRRDILVPMQALNRYLPFKRTISVSTDV